MIQKLVAQNIEASHAADLADAELSKNYTDLFVKYNSAADLADQIKEKLGKNIPI
jgi:hypothetical protein